MKIALVFYCISIKGGKCDKWTSRLNCQSRNSTTEFATGKSIYIGIILKYFQRSETRNVIYALFDTTCAAKRTSDRTSYLIYQIIMEKDQIKEADFGYRTDFLFSTSSFLSGMGSAVNLCGNFYRFNGSKSAYDADSIALESDFGMICSDLRIAVKRVLNENPKTLQAH